MFVQQKEFRRMVENRNPQIVEEGAKKLSCPVIVMDGTQPVAHNLQKIVAEIKYDKKCGTPG